MAVSEREVTHILNELVAANLVTEESAGQFAFRHALIHDTAYSMLLLRKRRQYHRAIAETIEQTYADMPDAHLGDLAYHYYQAGEWDKALGFSQRAGEKAQSLYAPREAIEHYTRALDAARQLAVAPSAHLYGARGRAYETVGEFEQAKADHEMALQVARAAADRQGEWGALVALGALWSGRDYTETGAYFRRALHLARDINDLSMIAGSLNRVGNWHANVEEPGDALRCHEEALSIFETIQEPRGIAETLDYLGIASYLHGDLVRGVAYYEQAVERFRALDDRQGLTSSLSVMILRGPTCHTDSVAALASLDECIRGGEAAVELAREIGWRAGEAFADVMLGLCLSAQGQFARSLDVTRTGLDIAQSIGHQQWQTAAQCGLGTLSLDMLDWPLAQQYLEGALATANELNSFYWIRATSAFLASALVAQNDLARADAVLSAAIGPELAEQTIAQRMCWCARAEWALASGYAAQAADITGQLLASAPGGSGQAPGLRVLRLRGEALTLLRKWDEAETVLRSAQDNALRQEARPALWRIQAALASLYQRQARHDDAGRERTTAHAVVEALAAGVPDDALREGFRRRALASIEPSAA